MRRREFLAAAAASALLRRVCQAQSLARHSDIRLTMGICAHIGLDDLTAAIESLPGPPEAKGSGDDAGTGRPDAA